MPIPQYNVGSGQKWSGLDAMRAFLDRIGEVAQRVAMMSVSIESLRNSFARLAELSGRLTASLLLLVGAPRVLRGDLYHSILRGTGAGGRSGGGSTREGNDDWVGEASESYKRYSAEKEAEQKASIDRLEAYRSEKRAKDEKKLFENQALWEATRLGSERLRAQRAFDSNVRWKKKVELIAAQETKVERLRGAGGPDFVKEESSLADMRMELEKLRLQLDPTDSLRRTARTPEQIEKEATRVLLTQRTDFPSLSHIASRTTGQKEASLSDLVKKTPPPVTLPTLIEHFKKGFYDEENRKKASEALKGLEKAANNVTYTFLGLAAGAQGLLRAASPDMYSTFTGSLQLFAASVGTVLVPMFYKLSVVIQKLSFGFLGLSANTKSAIGKLAEVVLTFTGVVTAANLLKLVLGNLSLKMTALAAGISFLVQGGFVAKQMREEERDFATRKRQAEDQRLVSMEDVKKDKALQEFLEKQKEVVGERGPETRARAADAYRSDLSTKIQQLEQSRENRVGTGADWFSRIFENMGIDDILTGITGSKTNEEQRKFIDDAIIRLNKRYSFLERYAQAQRGGKEIPGSLPANLSPADRASTAQSLLFNIQSLRAQPRFQAIDEAYKSIQVEALSKSPLEDMLYRIIGANLEALLRTEGQALGFLEQVNQLLSGATK